MTKARFSVQTMPVGAEVSGFEAAMASDPEQHGDVCEVEIEGIGILRNHLRMRGQ